MSADDRLRWDAKYRAKGDSDLPAPDQWLLEQVAELKPGRALELACGPGQNAIALAQLGWQVDAVDVSPIGLQIAADAARRRNVSVQWIAADLDDFIPSEGTYDLVVVFRFLDRERLAQRIERSLRPGGRLVYETFTQAHLARSNSHLKNPAFALEPDELPRLFSGLKVLSYCECELTDRSVARLVAEKTHPA